MKRSLLSIAAMTLMATSGFAQITLAEADYGPFVNTTDRAIMTNANSFPAVVGQPDHINIARPTGYTWNINGFYNPGDTQATDFVYYRHVATTGYEYADSSADGFGTYKFPKKVLTNIGPTGIIQPGERISRTWFSLATLSGAMPTDSFLVLGQDALYYNPGFSSTPAPRTSLKLPATMTPSTSWANNYFYTVKAIITYAAGGYAEDTFERRRYITENFSVIGYGNMRVRSYATGNPWTQYNNVLQVRAGVMQIRDSFFIDGVALTAMELAPFNLTQGQLTMLNRDFFYRTGEVVPFVQVHYTDASRNTINASDLSLIHTDRTPLTVEELMSSNSYAIYPNPVKGGNTLAIDLKDNDANGKWEYSLINIMGQQVASGSLNINGGKTNINVPKVAAGIYYIQASNGDKKIVKAMDIE